MKLYIKLFILAETLDLLSTIFVTKFLGGLELNPAFDNFYFFIITKIIVTILLVIYLSHLPIPKWFRILVVTISGIPAIWNILMIILYYAGRG